SWQIRGGHRLWAAPEDSTRTYAPDNGPVALKEIGPRTMRFTPEPESAFGLQKEMDITPEDSGSRVVVTHRIRNVGNAPTELAPWPLSVMVPGGKEVIPLPPHRPHPGSSANPDPKDFLPKLTIALWSYTDFKDPRWDFGSKFITLTHDARKGPTKFGLSHR